MSICDEYRINFDWSELSAVENVRIQLFPIAFNRFFLAKKLLAIRIQ